MKINGKDFVLNKSTTVSEYLEKNGYVQTHVVVELNEKILPKDMYERTYLKDEDCLEILTFMGGGWFENIICQAKMLN